MTIEVPSSKFCPHSPLVPDVDKASGRVLGMGRLPCDPLVCECFGSCKGDYSPKARTELLMLINERLSYINGRGVIQEKRFALLIDALGLVAQFAPMPAAVRPLIGRLIDGLKSA